MDSNKLKFVYVLNHLSAFIPVLAILLSLLIGSLPIIFTGNSPIEAFRWLLFGAAGNSVRLGATLTRATPILLSGLAATISFRSGVFNVGGEGQLYMGALGATLVALYMPPLPAYIHIPLCLLASFVFGAIWSLIPGILKAYKKIDEVIVTIMMNFIAFWIVSYLVHGPMREQNAMFSYTPRIPDTTILPILIKGTQLHLGYILALLVAVFVFILLNKSSLGYQMRAVGGNIGAAHYSGIDTKRVLLSVFWISGGIVGIAGALEILGVQYRLSDFFSPGYGWDGIGVALVGNTQVGGVLFASHFFALLRSGAGELERRMGVPSAIKKYRIK
jgi:ABC-type uncharacterized transport system permease subunit